MRKLVVTAALVGLASFAVPGGAHADAILVADDPAGDWGQAAGAQDASAGGSALGQDLIEASISPDYLGGIMSFVIKVAELSPIGGTPEATRYTWSMDVGGKYFELDGKYTNYSRGACDPTAGSCPPPRDPGPAPFFLRGNCVTTQNVTTCQELAKIRATFDQANASITIPVSITLLDPGAVCPSVATGTNIFGGFLSATPSAFFTSSAMPLDTMEDYYYTPVPTCDPEAE